ncbi:unnamed protein product, partial [Rotaria sordida]
MSDEKTSILNVWLNTNRNYQEIQRWYRSWHLLFPQAIINHIIIKEKLTKDLMMINQRISGTFNVQQTSPSQPFAIYNHGIAISSSTVISSFKDLVEKEATKHNLLFLPIQNRTSEDKQIYQFENILNVWLNTNRNYQEIQRWYSGWHLLFLQAIINHIIIKEKLTKDLMMINQRKSGTFNVQQTSPSQPFVNINY